MIADPSALPSEIAVSRSDSVYMAHGYLTKVPVGAIVPFINAFTAPGDVVADPFAGSGMTGVAAIMTGRRAKLSDISVLGQHIGSNYANLVDSTELKAAARRAVTLARSRTPGLYNVPCSKCGTEGELVKATWSQEYACGHCEQAFTYYRALEAADWRSAIRCHNCGASLQRRYLRRVGERMVLESVLSACSRKQVEQSPSGKEPPRFPELETWPDLAITPDREMYRRSALAKHNLTSTAKFFSTRNLTALTALRGAIREVGDESLRGKLLFAFTAILPRASKRYQWSRQRPLNAQNQTYYVSAVFYEWNVFDLFERKVEAAVAASKMIRGGGPMFEPCIDVTYEIASAHRLHHLESNSVDYVFTDPPFGSNIFYSDMNLFQEAWLGRTTDRTTEAVIATSVDNGSTPEKYELLLTAALRECYRVLKPGGWLSMVFSNSRGQVWGIAQRALKASGLELAADRMSSIDKGQRSVKGLASGWEGVVTTDLVFTAKKPLLQSEVAQLGPPTESVARSVDVVLSGQGLEVLSTPSRVYLAVIRRYIENHWDLEVLHFDQIIAAVLSRDLVIDEGTGKIRPVQKVVR